MPYALSLQRYALPEFYAEAPESWNTRLREISPILPHLAHLRFRKFEPQLDPKIAHDAGISPRGDWYFPERPIWAIYACTPIRLIDPERAEQFALHWSELPVERQAGRRGVVSDYQHFMWHTHGLSVRPFWLLQGEWGGTPATYTPRERRYLDASGAVSEPFPIGYFPACPFDERAVGKIVARDRLLQAGNRLDELEKMDRPDYLKAEDDEAERVYRETLLDTARVMAEPAIEFMKSQIARDTLLPTLPPAPDDLPDTLATWKETWMETGKMPGVRHAPSRLVGVQ